jgi:hypothetical protein
MHPCSTPPRLPRWGPRDWRRCSSLEYARYSRSSRLASRAGPPTRLPRWGPRAPRRSRCSRWFHPELPVKLRLKPPRRRRPSSVAPLCRGAGLQSCSSAYPAWPRRRPPDADTRPARHGGEMRLPPASTPLSAAHSGCGHAYHAHGAFLVLTPIAVLAGPLRPHPPALGASEVSPQAAQHDSGSPASLGALLAGPATRRATTSSRATVSPAVSPEGAQDRFQGGRVKLASIVTLPALEDV